MQKAYTPAEVKSANSIGQANWAVDPLQNNCSFIYLAAFNIREIKASGILLEVWTFDINWLLAWFVCVSTFSGDLTPN